MKSKRAEEFINRNIQPGPYGDGNFTDVDAEQAVELAEADARERAVRAFDASCPFGMKPIGEREFCAKGLACDGSPCAWRDNFLNHYDNEQ